jgi:hypothetical protein
VRPTEVEVASYGVEPKRMAGRHSTVELLQRQPADAATTVDVSNPIPAQLTALDRDLLRRVDAWMHTQTIPDLGDDQRRGR